MRFDKRAHSKPPRLGLRLVAAAVVTASGLGVLLLTAASHRAARISLSSTGMSMGPDQCNLPQLAFCDTFQTIVGGGREGDLDPTKWSFTRVSEQNNPSQGLVDNYAPSLAQFCKTTKLVQPDGDSFICGAQFNESNHWMESMDDNGQYVMNSNRIRQPFDFANRTGNIVFDVDAKTEGNHSFWPEVWITDQPVQGPHTDHPATHVYPRNGIGFVFNADWCGSPSASGVGMAAPTGNALREIDVFANYVETVIPFIGTSPCFTTQADMANHFQLKISQSHVEVWASDAGGMNFRQVNSVDLPALPFSRGYLSFEHAQYNSAKFNSTNTMTYHWHAIGFDGPVLPLDRSYEVPDALAPVPDGTVNLGYEVPTKAFQLAGVDLSNVAQAYLTYSTYYFSAPKTITATINGTSRSFADPNPDAASAGGYQWRYSVQPVALADLHQGTNTVTFSTPSCGGGMCPTLANIDLELVLNDNAPATPPTTMAMPPTTTTPVSPTTVPKSTTTTVAMPTTTLASPPASASTGGVKLDRQVSRNAGPGSTLISPGLSTSAGNELLIAFLSSDGPGMPSSQSFTSVTGGGLTWSRVVASNAQSGAAEIWTAFSTNPVSNLTVTATRAAGGYEGSITVAAFKGASGTGAVAAAAGPGAAPSAALTTTSSGSWVWGVGHDWDNGLARTAGPSQTLVRQYVDTNIGDTSWVQRQTSITAAAGTPVTISDTAPTTDEWNLAAIEIRPN